MGGIWKLGMNCNVKIFNVKANKFEYNNKLAINVEDQYISATSYSQDYSVEEIAYGRAISDLGKNLAATYEKRSSCDLCFPIEVTLGTSFGCCHP